MSYVARTTVILRETPDHGEKQKNRLPILVQIQDIPNMVGNNNIPYISTYIGCLDNGVYSKILAGNKTLPILA